MVVSNNECSDAKVITVEDGAISGGFGTAILEFSSKNNYQVKIKNVGIPDNFIHQGTVDELQHQVGLDVDSIQKELEKNI